MKTMARWTVAMIIATAGFFSLPQAALAQGGTQIHSSAETGLVVDKWQMILPEIVEEDDGRMWLRHTLPDGSYQSLPFKVGDPLTMKWYKPGNRGLSDYPAGWSIEDTQSIVDWHMSGGRGDFVIEGGEWKEMDPNSAPSSTSSASATSSTSSTDDDCSGPYCDDPVTGVQSVSTANDPDRIIPPIPDEPGPNRMLDLKKAWDAAKRLCDDPGNPDRSKACGAADKAQREYLEAAAAGGN